MGAAFATRRGTWCGVWVVGLGIVDFIVVVSRLGALQGSAAVATAGIGIVLVSESR